MTTPPIYPRKLHWGYLMLNRQERLLSDEDREQCYRLRELYLQQIQRTTGEFTIKAHPGISEVASDCFYHGMRFIKQPVDRKGLHEFTFPKA